ncbi:MAG: phage tail assembly protein [Alcaligenaceae bacterium]|nr:phage tail assembly protein [Alcaligenaceae bacterium]
MPVSNEDPQQAQPAQEVKPSNPPVDTKITKTVTLDQPIVRGNSTITTLTIRKPTAGELRGVKLMDLANMDVSALVTVLPRITIPSILKQEVEKMDPADLTELGTEVALFLAKKSVLTEFQQG